MWSKYVRPCIGKIHKRSHRFYVQRGHGPVVEKLLILQKTFGYNIIIAPLWLRRMSVLETCDKPLQGIFTQ